MNNNDLKYARLLSNHLDRYTVKSEVPFKATFRCVVCGDSQKSKTKTRGWILEKPKNFHYYCHNCGASYTLKNFLKIYFPTVYSEYIMKDYSKTVQTKKLEIRENPYTKKANIDLPSVESLEDDHRAKAYIRNRLIPKKFWKDLYYTHDFNSWVNSHIPEKMSNDHTEPRIIIPFLNEKGEMVGYQGRSLNPNSKLRYITIMIREDEPKIYGLNNVNWERRYFVFEGPIDSMFVDNGLAAAGASWSDLGLKNIGNAVWIFDNEPRNKQIVNLMKKVIKSGRNIVIWPNDLNQKDVNDMALAGVDYNAIIDANIYSGLAAELRFSSWKKV